MRHRLQKRGDRKQGIREKLKKEVETVGRLAFASLRLGKRSEEVGDWSVVAESLADMRISIYVARTEDEATPELKRILSKAVLSVSCFSSPLARNRIVIAQDVQDRCAL